MRNRNERLAALALIGAVALNYPLLSLFADSSFLLGIPLLYLYLFVFWAVFILIAGLIIEPKDYGDMEVPAQAEQSTTHQDHDA